MIHARAAARPRKKVLHLCAVGFSAKTLLLPQIDRLRASELDVELAFSPDDTVDELRARGYTVHPIAIDRRIAPASNVRSIGRLAALMRANAYDLVHVHSPIASVLGRIAARLARVPRVVYTAHGFYFHEHMPRARYRFFHGVERGAAMLTDLILCQSREDVATATRTLCPESKVRYIGNGIDLARFARARGGRLRRRDLGIPDDALAIGITGRVTEEKGHRELVDALARLAPRFARAHLVVVGGQLDTERDAFQAVLEREVARAGLGARVTFTGFRNDVPDVLNLLDVFALPSWREGMPRSVLEALACELPVVATDIRGCRECVRDGATGLLVPLRDPGRLADALARLLADEPLRRAMGKRARAVVESEFDERAVLARIESAYRELGMLSS